MKNAIHTRKQRGTERVRLRWPARPRRREAGVARHWCWTSRCRRYRVVRSHILYGEGAIPDVYYAQRYDAAARRWDLLDGHHGRHRTRRAAMRHCEQDAKRS